MPARNLVISGPPDQRGRYRYRGVDRDEPRDEDRYTDLQFKRSPPRVPYKAIALAAVLFLIGSLLITIGSLLLAGYFGDTHSDRTVPVLVIGILVFLPGFYHLRIAYHASRGHPGFSYEDIPDFDD